MKLIYVELAERIRGAAQDLDRVVQRAAMAWAQASRMSDADAYLDSADQHRVGERAGPGAEPQLQH